MKGPTVLKDLNSELDTLFILFTASQSKALEYEKSLTTKPAENDDDFAVHLFKNYYAMKVPFPLLIKTDIRNSLRLGLRMA